MKEANQKDKMSLTKLITEEKQKTNIHEKKMKKLEEDLKQITKKHTEMKEANQKDKATLIKQIEVKKQKTDVYEKEMKKMKDNLEQITKNHTETKKKMSVQIEDMIKKHSN